MDILRTQNLNRILVNGTLNSKAYTILHFDPYNPLDLPPNTVRVRTVDWNPPLKGSLTSYETATLVEGTTDVYDVYKSGTSFDDLLNGSTNVVEVLGANTTGIVSANYMFYYCTSITALPLFDTSSVTNMVCMFSYCRLTTVPLFNTSSVTNMSQMFEECTSLTSVPLFDTSSVTNMSKMFYRCISLTSAPLLDTSSVTNMSRMFYDCIRVQSGALALYQQASTQAVPPQYHTQTFRNCGDSTTTGRAEVAQIPDGWK